MPVYPAAAPNARCASPGCCCRDRVPRYPSDLTDAKWDRGSTDGEIFLVIRDGAGPDFTMKGYKGRMADNDIWNVVNYLRSVGPKK